MCPRQFRGLCQIWNSLHLDLGLNVICCSLYYITLWSLTEGLPIWPWKVRLDCEIEWNELNSTEMKILIKIIDGRLRLDTVNLHPRFSRLSLCILYSDCYCVLIILDAVMSHLSTRHPQKFFFFCHSSRTQLHCISC